MAHRSKREATGSLHVALLPGLEDRLTTDRAVDKALRNGPLNHGQKEAVRLILSADNRAVGVQRLLVAT